MNILPVNSNFSFFINFLSILFLTLKTFSATGGIEKVGRVAGKAVYEYSHERGRNMKVFSMYDPSSIDTEPYLPNNIFKGFGGNKFLFVSACIRHGLKSKVIILTHVKLLLPGYLVKLLSKKTRLILIAHGKEVWRPLPSRTKKMLNACDIILPVSQFTKDKMSSLYGLGEEKFRVLSNCLDPYLPAPADESHRHTWREKYGIAKDDVVLMTLTRLTLHEKNKGYDKILVAVQALSPAFPNLKYVIAGKYDEAEKARLDKLINELGVNDKIVFTGFVPGDELADHYNMCDVYIMPSEKEGFGISFIEAMYYGKPVIAGNRDGTTDALLNGKLGVLIDPRSQEEITGAIEKVIKNISAFSPNRELLMEHFSYEVYREKWGEVLRQA